ncbi:LOW QUALITY PROTEIN: uncharacterized protein LOC115756371 [Rhodamnia argentea]|uniref:LOW QUALITY PROTEIN: uncharacterized protein LOC115756371 n=1 Tax=Rhodamnia argentea TaxID=178133 RepID=A0A8B8QXM1_9MYRT|nr:LOW QUALITY PROTEIN: uncharacterized protein LOC115756371 [Rhodamnia argentea]
MEALYLLCSIVSTCFTSLALSLLLPVHALLRWLYGSRAGAAACESAALYEGTVWHERRRPVRHSFQYAVRYALIDLDRAPHAPPGHLSADEARHFADTNGPIFLLTIPPSVGYEQNPLSLYYCYDIKGATQHLQKCIAEVTNTPWGERVLFVFSPNSDLVAKPLHVSPFMDMLGNWSIKANAPEDNLFVAISVQHPKLGNYFTATLKAKRVSSSTLSNHATFFWLMPHKVAIWIYWHAFKLWWKNVSFIQHPRNTNPRYREEAAERDRGLRCCEAFHLDGMKDSAPNRTVSDSSSGKSHIDRCFVWRDAKWPWS